MGREPRIEVERTIGADPAVAQVRGDVGRCLWGWKPTEVAGEKGHCCDDGWVFEFG